MSKIRDLFSTPKKAILSSVCAAAILLALGGGTVFAAGAVAESSAIGIENAQNFAFADAGIDPVSAAVERTEFDFEMGQFVYEVEFEANGTEYEYWIKASNGTVLKKNVEILTLDGSNVTATAKITLDQAKETVLSDAGLSELEVTFTEGKLDVENGISVYDIAFYAGDAEYEYEVNADTGAIYSRSRETEMDPAASAIRGTSNTGTSTQNAAATQSGSGRPNQAETPAADADPRRDDSPKQDGAATQIGLDAAKSKALADADVSASDVTYTKEKLDYDDGIAVYDIEFYTSTNEYEYEINAATGAVRERSVEALKVRASGSEKKPDDPAPQAPKNTDSHIGLDQAKGIAIDRAGLSVSDVTFKKAKLDYDDGIAVYEIEFVKNGMEYDCEINAATGAILEYDCERDD